MCTWVYTCHSTHVEVRGQNSFVLCCPQPHLTQPDFQGIRLIASLAQKSLKGHLPIEQIREQSKTTSSKEMETQNKGIPRQEILAVQRSRRGSVTPGILFKEEGESKRKEMGELGDINLTESRLLQSRVANSAWRLGSAIPTVLYFLHSPGCFDLPHFLPNPTTHTKDYTMYHRAWLIINFFTDFSQRRFKLPAPRKRLPCTNNKTFLLPTFIPQITMSLSNTIVGLDYIY